MALTIHALYKHLLGGKLGPDLILERQGVKPWMAMG